MKVEGVATRSIWLEPDGAGVGIIDQTLLPFELERRRLTTVEEAAHAIRAMLVRGAPLIGATAAYGMALAMRADPGDASVESAAKTLLATRPTAVNLRWAVEDLRSLLKQLPSARRAEAAYRRAGEIADSDVTMNRAIAGHGLPLIQQAWEKKGKKGPVDILTHCNAGWLAAVDWGTALAPVYLAFDQGIPLHVWVDETRPRNQ